MIDLETLEPKLIDFGAAQYMTTNEDGEQRDLDAPEKAMVWLKKVLENPEKQKKNLLII